MPLPATFRLDDSDKAKLKALATARSQTLTAVIVNAIRTDYSATFGTTPPADALDRARRLVA